jgi:hypothetical protein
MHFYEGFNSGVKALMHSLVIQFKISHVFYAVATQYLKCLKH